MVGVGKVVSQVNPGLEGVNESVDDRIENHDRQRVSLVDSLSLSLCLSLVFLSFSLLMSMCCALIDLFLVTYYILVQVMKPGIELPTCAQVLA